MNFEEIKKTHKKLSLMAFVQDGDAYIVDVNNILKIEDEIKDYCQAVKDYVGEDDTGNMTHPYVRHPYASEAVDNLLEAYEQFKTSLRELRLPVNEVRLYQRKNTKGEGIEQYERIKRHLKYAMIPMLHQRPQYGRQARKAYPLINKEGPAQTRNQKTILNHNNPFADITIENQSFIYPGDDGTYQTLQFHTGYTMSKVEDETSCAVVLQPDFKISKTEERDSVRNTITMDNTITTKLPDKQGEQELIYI